MRSASSTASSTSCVTSSDRPRLARQRVGEPALHLAARQRVERAERLVEAQHRARRRAACAGTRRAGACRRTARAAGALEALEAERGEVLVRGGARSAASRRRPRAAPAPALSSADSHGSSPSRCGISAAGAASTVPRVGLLRARRRAPAASTCRSRSARRRRRPRAAPRAGTRRPGPSRPRTPSQPPATVDAAGNVTRLHAGSLDLGPHRSLRGHYPTGSKGQVQRGPISSRAFSQPPWFSLHPAYYLMLRFERNRLSGSYRRLIAARRS